jgi:hypothetical protein
MAFAFPHAQAWLPVRILPRSSAHCHVSRHVDHEEIGAEAARERSVMAPKPVRYSVSP